MPFRDIVGHDVVRGLLMRAVARGNLPPSLIFAGPAGVGKATTAVALAQLVNCEDSRHTPPAAASDPREAVDACGQCASCRRIERAALAYRGARDRPAVDCLQWLAPDERGSIKIDVVRDLLKRAGFRPFDGRRRLVLVDDAHDLEPEAQQALLKALEEPPSATAFVLVTPQPDALLATVRSRCPLLRFGPLAAAAVADVLVRRHGWAEGEAAAAAAMSGGSVGAALRAREAAGLAARDVAVTVLRRVASSRHASDRLDAAQALLTPQDRCKRGGEGKGRASVTRYDVIARLEAMAVLLRDLAVLTSGGDPQRLANTDVAPRLDTMRDAFRGVRLSRAFAAVEEARTALERNAGHKLVADWLVLQL
jgi:DNA polymerase-3 subunit delta'